MILTSQHQEDEHDLTSDIELWREIFKKDSTPELTRSVLATVIYVATKLQQDRALLLPHVTTVFLQHYTSRDTEELYLDLGDGRVKFSSRWLMHQLIMHLQPYMHYKCVIKRLGTLLYSKNSDVLKCLSLALHDTQSADNESPFPDAHEQHERQPAILREAGNIINDAIHQEVSRQKSSHTDLTTFSLDDSLTDNNTLLWDFVCSCTRSVRERTGRANNDDAHVKTIRRLFIMCAMPFATNSSCDTALHHLVADTVEVLGGSRKLIRVLNRLGVCVSSDTHDRLVTQVAQAQKSQGVWSELPRQTFTIASVDNVDFLQSNVAVYCGDQSRSYHGTTIQVVQPVPSICVPSATPDSLSPAQPVTNSLQKRPCGTSPSNSPHCLGKVGPKRKRTLELSPVQCYIRVSENSFNPVLPSINLKLEQFQEGEADEASTLRLHKQVFSYSILKVCLPALESGTVLRQLRDFIIPSQAQLADHDPSTIFYMDILDENADSEQTMTVVADMINVKLLSTSPQQWMVLVGDGKTFVHLQRVKRLYRADFQNLLIYPGDWHILKNFQPVLMKAYYHAGLKDIAMLSGYRGETLTSLEKCSHFQRTHAFLV